MSTVTRSTTLRLRPAQLFAVAAIGIVTICAIVLRSQAFARNPDLVAWAATFDLTLSLPLVYYVMIVRRGHARPITVAPVFVIGVAIAARLAPHGFAQELRFVAAPLELVTIALVARRLAAKRADDDPLTRAVAFEITTLYYALFSWRKPTSREGWSVHERSGWGTIVAAFLIVIAGEGIGMHVVVAMWSPRAAWLWTALDLYGALWLIGDYQALRVRRITLDDDALQLRYGLRANATIPYDAIAAVEAHSGEWHRRKGTLKVAIGDAPRIVIRLRQPMTIQCVAGIRKSVDTIGILADDDGFEAALRARLASQDQRVPEPTPRRA
jgi:hypothetical protein